MKKKLFSAAVTAAIVLTLGTGIMAPAYVEAGNIFGGVVGTVVAGAATMQRIDAQLDIIEGEGRDEFFELMKEKYGVDDSYKANAQLDRIMSRLSAVIVNYDPSVREKPYNYFVNKDKSFNAFCTLGHNISVNIGLFNVLNYNEDQIALIVGHELAHGTNKDPRKGVKKQVGVKVMANIVASSMGGSVLSNLGTSVLANLGTAKGITMPMEKRADADAFTYCSEAGYNVGAGAAVWQKIIDLTADKKSSANKINQIFNPSDHPKHVNRRDAYSKSLTAYSNNMVSVNKDTGEITVNKVNIGVPAAAFGQSALERSYMVAGDIADVYHADGKVRPNAYTSGGYVYLGNKAVLTITSGDNANHWVTNLNAANAGK